MSTFRILRDKKGRIIAALVILSIPVRKWLAGLDSVEELEDTKHGDTKTIGALSLNEEEKESKR